MRLGLGGVGGERLELDLSQGEHARRLVLREIRGLSGTLITRPTALDLGPASIDSLTIERATWETEHARLTVEAPARVNGARIDLELPRGGAGGNLTGSITASGFERAIISVERRGHRTTAALAARDLTYRGGPDREIAATAGELTLHEIQTMLGGLLVRVGSMTFGGVTALLGEDPTIDVESIRVPHVELSGELLDASIRGVELTGVRYRDGAIEIDAVRVETIEVAIDLLAGAAQRGANRTSVGPVDLRVLDQLNGTIAVDLALDVAVPVIGRRKATHRFRLGIETGTLDFAQLERGLAGLENAFLDFRVRGDRLILERDIPLIPGDNKPILIWPLDEPGEPELAARKRVRLRRLSRFTVAGREQPREGKSAVTLHALTLGDLDVELSMSAARAGASPDAAVQTLDGWIRRAEVEIMRATGAVRHAPGGEPEPGLLELNATGLEVELAEVPAGGATLDRTTARVDTIESVRIAFTGLRPTAIQAHLGGLSLGPTRLTT